MSLPSDPKPAGGIQTASPETSFARLQTILKSEPECVKIVNEAGQLVELNPAGLKMLGATDIEQVRGTHLSMMVDTKDWPTYEQNLAGVFQGKTLQWQFRCNSPCGKQRWMEQTAGPVYCDKNPEIVTEMVAITRDITEKKRDEVRLLTAKENAERANAAKTNFLANMSHEIRTPMNGILGMVNMLTETELTDDQKAWLSVIQQSSDSLLRILNDILDLSKVEAGRIELENSRFCINHQIEEIQRFHSPNATRKGLALDITGCEHMQLQRTGDSTRLLQILNNLFDNAIKFTSHGSVTGSFTCDACFKPSLHESEQDPNRVHFVISDTGIGMTEEQIRKVFAPFSQADPTTTRRYGGTGLGLTIAKTLTELMRGSLQVESVITEGTTFEVTLNLAPVAQVTASTEDTETTSGLPEESENPVRILAVEDGEVNQLVLKHILNKMNTEVSMVHNGKEAVEAFKNKKFDLVLMDIHMPIMDGFAATTEIRSIEEKRGSRKTPIVAVTASVTDAEVDHYKTFGFSHCIAKPTELSRIREVIDSIRN